MGNKLRNVAKALLMLLAGLAGMVAVTAILDHPVLVSAYSKRFDFRPGAVMGEKVAASVPSDETCIVLGASTARQAFDPTILKAAVPATRFLNGGLTGGTIEVLELQARIIARYGLRYRCIIAALHPWLLKNVQRPEIVATEYSAHLGPLGPLYLSDNWWMEKELYKVALALMLPMRKHSGQFNRLIRYGIFSAQASLLAHPLPVKAFEVLKDDLEPYSSFAYPGNPKQYVERHKVFEDALRGLSWLDPTVYCTEPTMKAFRSALALLVNHTERLFVVTLPDTPLWDGPNSWATPAYFAAIESLGYHVTHIDCRGILALDEFVDHAHPNDDGRRVLSRAVGEILHSELSPTPNGQFNWVSGGRACTLGVKQRVEQIAIRD